MFALRFSLVFTLLLAQAVPVLADGINAQRARYNYQMFCQGCHTPDGSGANSVPRLKDFVGTFLLSEQGREFLVRVPGAATSALADPQLAEVLNYILLEFGGDSVSAGFTPYTAQEVGELRQRPLFEVNHERVRVLTDIASYQMEDSNHD